MITDHQLSILCDVARSAGTDLSAEKQAALVELVAARLVAPADNQSGTHTRYKVTPAGQAVLDERGVGANES